MFYNNLTLKPWLGDTQGYRNRHGRSAAYVLLTFYSNQGPISYRFRDIRRFQWKIAKFSQPACVLCALADSPWIWALALGSINYRDGATGPKRKFDVIFSCVDTIDQRDRQTDRWADGHQRAYADTNTKYTDSIVFEIKKKTQNAYVYFKFVFIMCFEMRIYVYYGPCCLTQISK